MLLPELQDFVKAYKWQRTTLYRDIEPLTIEAIDWKSTPTSVTIGSSLLHMGGIESLLVGAITGRSVSELWRAKEWERFKPGFPRELSIQGPSTYPVSYYLNILQEVASDTMLLLENMSRSILEAASEFFVEFEEFKDRPLKTMGNRELLFYILQHAEYHRGQITLLKFLFSRLSRCNP